MTMLALAMALLGLAAHFLKDMARIKRDEGRILTLKAYWAEHPNQTGLSLIGVAVGVVVLWQTGELSPLSAFGAGYMANSMADVLGKRSAGKV